jgi:hypothetical protein
MWPLTPLPVSPDVRADFLVLLAVCLLFVFAVFTVLIARFTTRPRRLRRVICPEDGRRALVLVRQFSDGRAAVGDCSNWHDGKLDCGRGCVDPAA